MKRQSALRKLVVIDRLEIGAVELEPRRATAPYRVIRADKDEAFELSYTYAESVFEPEDAFSINLAALLLAQVALNYGLFCGEMVFRGPFDEADRRFITEMAANTAREIYVNKFLETNPFLEGDAARLSAVVDKSYRAARLVFGEGPKSRTSWASSSERHAVLSSGGKDSLLTFGLLRELGRECHPIFLNESGRHWFTALNAYRSFAASVPLTARVWTNADHLFSWMLRRLPFVRKDFASIRSDEYPIRLWTVAVFAFGALPLLRKRGIGRLLTGNEFDTTTRTSYRGITHYAGLYDQSRYFDENLTRFFRRKGFDVAQFSILRLLSGLRIQTTPCPTYPMTSTPVTSRPPRRSRFGRSWCDSLEPRNSFRGSRASTWTSLRSAPSVVCPQRTH